MINRRVLMGATLAASSFPQLAFGQATDFQSLLSALDADQDLVEDAWDSRERQTGRGSGHGARSDRAISPTAMDLIVRLEVGSRARYERLYTRPIWPRGRSGVTIGIGYDLGYADRTTLERDWSALLSADMIEALVPVLRLRGTAARDAKPTVQNVIVPWDAAYRQFVAFIPYPTKETETTFENCADLSDDSFGALVSLVYNRGSSMSQDDERRREMRELRDLMRTKNFADVPAKILEMRRLWQTPETRGLVLRRELEAALFTNGMA